MDKILFATSFVGFSALAFAGFKSQRVYLALVMTLLIAEYGLAIFGYTGEKIWALR